ncbi:hypothetical protein LQG66_04185 [Bradyrhizobium ontarionense]|uniref:Uncharacterized protein n=1 Tax=Bradyrhizobium ontarionense TaxID=2898149 RepID=A0ABY3RDM7_9BRAD|nr:hypothetical protein [Bradyrhizobium sp. A19]UFZ05525.1 hypothetical protein LQG66_04185 [Bradyrhizobium sp. A19]
MDRKLADLARFAGQQFRFAFQHMDTHGFANTALGTTMTGWWTPKYHLQVLQTDDAAFVEAMAMNWLDADHRAWKFAGIVMNGSITVDGKSHNSLILRSQTTDHSRRLVAYHPYYGEANKEEPWLTPFVDFPADRQVSPRTQKAVQDIMLKTRLGIVT